jgi:MOSC domain-containing protein YiiM
MVKWFLASGRTGFYLAVTREGEVGVGDEMKLLSQEPNSIPISVITRLYIAREYDSEDLRQVQKARDLSALPDSWKQWLWERANRRRV